MQHSVNLLDVRTVGTFRPLLLIFISLDGLFLLELHISILYANFNTILSVDHVMFSF